MSLSGSLARHCAHCGLGSRVDWSSESAEQENSGSSRSEYENEGRRVGSEAVGRHELNG